MISEQNHDWLAIGECFGAVNGVPEALRLSLNCEVQPFADFRESIRLYRQFRFLANGGGNGAGKIVGNRFDLVRLRDEAYLFYPCR